MTVFAVVTKAILALAAFFDSLMRDVSERRSVQAGEDAATARTLEEQTARVEKARAARRSIDSDRLPDDDPYRRD